MRHGEARDNVKQVLSSDNLACSFLTKKGVKQVKITVDKIARIKRIDKVYYSPLIRTIQTARFLKELNLDIEFIVDRRIREINYGIYSNKKNNTDLDNIRELQKKGDFFIRFGKYDENKFEIYQRLISFLDDIQNNNFDNNNIVIISHGSIISFLMKILGVTSTHLKKGEFQILENVDFSNIERAKALQHNATNIEIKQRLDQLESIKQYPLLLKDIARLDYNDIHFDRQVFKDLCLSFVDNLSLVNDDAIRFKGSSFFNPICVCIFRNFGNFLEKWISHYSLLGITKFAMISCDDKVNKFSKLKVYFEKEQNIKIDFWRWEGYFNCSKECSIKQRIADYYGKNNWFLFVDSDELFIYPDFRKTKIQENTKFFCYVIDGYADDYDKDSLRSLIMDWESFKNKKFEDYYPKTANLVTKLKKLNDGVERNIKTYETVLNEVTMAKQEIIRSLRGNQ